jgi:sigma-54 specific flagellar transcriptional regulator A
VRLTPAALASLCRYQWPGNVRELANVIERLVILFPYGTVDFDDLPEKFQLEGGQLPEAVAAVIESGPSLAPVEEQATDEKQVSVTESKTETPQSIEELPEEGLDLKEHLANLEYLLIKQALDESSGVVAHAANKLKMRRTTLVEKMRKYGIQRDVD